MSACWFVILSAAKDLILRKQADCHAPSCHHKAKVIPVAGARSDGLAAACVRWAQLASATRLSVISSLRAKRGIPPVSLSLRAKRGNPPLVFLFFFARFAATQRYPKGTLSACWFVILSAVKDLNLRKQADCRAPSRYIKAKVIPVAGARSDG